MQVCQLKYSFDTQIEDSLGTFGVIQMKQCYWKSRYENPVRSYVNWLEHKDFVI